MKTLIALTALLLAGCSSPASPDSWEYPAQWEAAVECWSGLGHAAESVNKPVVIERTDCTGSVPQHFAVAGTEAYGAYWSGVIHVCPDLAALPHELAHHFAFKLTGDVGANGDGRCGL